jgi:hypothetical protein
MNQMNREQIAKEMQRAMYPSDPDITWQRAFWLNLADWHIAQMKERTEACRDLFIRHCLGVLAGSALGQKNTDEFMRDILALDKDETEWWSFCPVCGKERPKG